MAVLVTGGAGYIGSHMVWALIDAGEEVVVLDRLSTGFRWAVSPEARFYEGDIADGALLSTIFSENSIDAIMHFAGSIIVPESVENPLKYYHNNTAKSRTLIEAAVRAGVRHMIFSSTAATYGVPEVSPVREDCPQIPINPYGMSKLMTEIMLRDTAAAHDFRYAALRYFNVAGADPKGRTGQSSKRATHLIKIAAQAALGQRDGMDVFGTDYPTPDGTCLRDYIHVSDLIEAHVLTLMHLMAGGDTFVANAGYGRGFSVLEVIDAVKRVSGVDFPVRMAPRRAGDPPALVADSTRLRSITGWQPRLDNLDTIVAHALNWEKTLAKRNFKP